MLPDLSTAQLVEQLRTMLRIRRFEEALIRLAATGDIGRLQVSVGQESTDVPALAHLRDRDVAHTTPRNHGQLIARGVPPAGMAAEILGKATGICRGKGGALHLASAGHGIPMTSSSAGGPLLVAVGSAFAFQELRQAHVSVALFGPEALEGRAWYEAASIAAIRRVPVIFVCQIDAIVDATLTDRVWPLGVAAEAVDGTDVGAVSAAVGEAVDRARGGGGPSFIEARTMPRPGDRPPSSQLLTGATDVSYAWDADAIPTAHTRWWSEGDGVLRYLRELLAAAAVTRDAALEIDAAAIAEMDEAVEFALRSPYPQPREALDHVFA